MAATRAFSTRDMRNKKPQRRQSDFTDCGPPSPRTPVSLYNDPKYAHLGKSIPTYRTVDRWASIPSSRRRRHSSLVHQTPPSCDCARRQSSPSKSVCQKAVPNARPSAHKLNLPKKERHTLEHVPSSASSDDPFTTAKSSVPQIMAGIAAPSSRRAVVAARTVAIPTVATFQYTSGHGFLESFQMCTTLAKQQVAAGLANSPRCQPVAATHLAAPSATHESPSPGKQDIASVSRATNGAKRLERNIGVEEWLFTPQVQKDMADDAKEPERHEQAPTGCAGGKDQALAAAAEKDGDEDGLPCYHLLLKKLELDRQVGS